MTVVVGHTADARVNLKREGGPHPTLMKLLVDEPETERCSRDVVGSFLGWTITLSISRTEWVSSSPL